MSRRTVVAILMLITALGNSLMFWIMFKSFFAVGVIDFAGWLLIFVFATVGMILITVTGLYWILALIED